MAELRDGIKNLTNLAGVIRDESLYIMERIQKDRIAKELMPHYSQLLEIFKRSNVFVTNDVHSNIVTGVNQAFAALDIKLGELQVEIEKLKEGGKKNGRWSKIFGRSR